MTRLSRSAGALTIVLPLLLAGAACGGDDDGGGDRLSKADFIKQGDAICDGLNKSSEKVSPEGQELDDLVKFLDQIIVLVQGARDDIAALTPPEDGEDVQNTLVKSLEAGVRASREAQEAARKEDQAGVAKALQDIQKAGEEIQGDTAEYGFKVCSESS